MRGGTCITSVICLTLLVLCGMFPFVSCDDDDDDNNNNDQNLSAEELLFNETYRIDIETIEVILDLFAVTEATWVTGGRTVS